MSEVLRGQGSGKQSPVTGSEISGELARSWRPMLAIVLGMWISGLPAYSIGAFIGPISTQFGWTTTRTAGWSLAWSFGCIVSAPMIGMVADRIGARRVILAGLAALAVILIAVARFTSDIELFYVGGFAIGAATAATSAITYGRVVGSLFDRGLGTALGLMSTGIGLAAVTGPPLMQSIIDHNNWRWAFAVEGALPLVILPLLFAWLPRWRNHDKGGVVASEAGVTRLEAMRSWPFWVLAAGTILYGICVGGVSVNLIPYLTSEGMERADAAAAAGLFGIATVIGRFVAGITIDRLPIHAARLLALMLIGEGLTFVLLGTTGRTYLYLALPLFGLAVGAEADCLAYCIIRIYGRRFFSSIFGVLGIVMLYTGTGVGPVLFSATHDLCASYATAFYVWAALAFIGAPLFASVAAVPFLRIEPA